MKKIISYFIIYSIPVVFFAWAVFYIYHRPEQFVKVFSLSTNVLFLLFLSQFFSIWVTSLFTKVMANIYGVELSFREYFGITTIARTLNMLLPMKGGAGVRALYLKTHHQLPISDFVAMFAGQTVLTLFVSSVLCLLGLVLIYFTMGVFDPLGGLFFLGVAIVFGFFVFWSPVLSDSDEKVWKIIKRILDSWHKLRSNYLVVVKVAIISAVNTLLSAFSIGLLFWALGNPLALSASLYLGGSQDVMYLASFTPGALGVVETSTVLLSKNLSINVSDALLVALIVRALVFLVATLFTPYFVYYLFNGKLRQLYKR